LLTAISWRRLVIAARSRLDPTAVGGAPRTTPRGFRTSCAINQYARIVQRRIMGIETEFGVTCTFHGHRRLSPDEVARYLFRRVVSWGRSSNVFLRNGARLYLDVGSHPEYATAECDSLVQLVTHDRAGERVLEDLLVDAEQRLADEGIGGDIYLFKNNTDSAGNSTPRSTGACTSSSATPTCVRPAPCSRWAVRRWCWK
jgi:hypothetical protein